MVSMGEVIGAFNIIALGCASVDLVDVRLTVEAIRSDDGELDPAMAVSIIASDQTNAVALASLLGLKPTRHDTWSGAVTPADAVLPARCTVTSRCAVTTAPLTDTGLLHQTRVAS
ncbi:hypothetical protein [Promicromonospora soli]